MLALSALVSVLPALASAATCVQFDSDKNLYAFGGEQDVAFGTADTWGCESPAAVLVCCCCAALACRGMALSHGQGRHTQGATRKLSIAFAP